MMSRRLLSGRADSFLGDAPNGWDEKSAERGRHRHRHEWVQEPGARDIPYGGANRVVRQVRVHPLPLHLEKHTHHGCTGKGHGRAVRGLWNFVGVVAMSMVVN